MTMILTIQFTNVSPYWSTYWSFKESKILILTYIEKIIYLAQTQNLNS